MSYYSDMILATPGLVSYWRLGEASGSALDSKGSHHGTVNGGITRNVTGLLTGDADGAVQGNGAVGSYINVPYAASMNTGAKLSVECWVKPAVVSGGIERVVGRHDDTNNIWYINIAGSQWEFAVRDTGGTNFQIYSGAGPGAAAVGVRQHLVMTYDAAGAMKAYVNGVVVGSDNTPNTDVSPSVGLGIRLFVRATSVVGFNGVIDEPAFYNVALTPAQIADHYNVGSTGAPAAVANPIMMVV